MGGGGVGASASAVLQIIHTLGWVHFSQIPVWRIPLVLIPVGALGGAVVALVRGVRVSQAARRLDGRYDLKERLSTAAELLDAGDESSEAAFVYAQARRAARSLPRRLEFGRRSARLPILLLTIVLCASLLLVPDRTDRLAEQLLAPDAQQKKATIDSLHRLAAVADPETQAMLLQLADVIEVKNEAELRQILEKLRRAGVDVALILTGNIPPQRTEGHSTDGTGSDETVVNPTEKSTAEGDSSERIRHAAVTAVYHPRYTVSDAPPREPSPRATVGLPHTETPWKVACARAARAGRNTTVPDRYRSILRVFTDPSFSE